ncbi:MAG: hypothetical protein MJ181_09935 [Treponema sp.]|nr:hypothetical protein [Lachnospiraceae bacterium]MCQ2598150.1 hypothetical protein [Treponema sp.]
MNTVIIDGEEYIKKSDVGSTRCIAQNTEGLLYVCIRTYSAGVHCGYLKERNGKEVELVNARRIWKWSGAFTLSELATKGVTKPEECKIACVVPCIYLTEAIEIIPMTEDAADSIQKVAEYDCND